MSCGMISKAGLKLKYLKSYGLHGVYSCDPYMNTLRGILSFNEVMGGCMSTWEIACIEIQWNNTT